jgi:hypothetical protein
MHSECHSQDHALCVEYLRKAADCRDRARLAPNLMVAKYYNQEAERWEAMARRASGPSFG